MKPLNARWIVSASCSLHVLVVGEAGTGEQSFWKASLDVF